MSDIFDISTINTFQVGYHVDDNIILGGFNENCISLDYNVLSSAEEWEITDKNLETIIQICDHYNVNSVLINFSVIFNTTKELYFPKNLKFIVDADTTIRGKTITNLNMLVKPGWALYIEEVNKLILNNCNLVARVTFIDEKKIPIGNYKLNSNVLRVGDPSLEWKITENTVQTVVNKILRNNTNTNIQRLHIVTGKDSYYNLSNNFFKYPNEELLNTFEGDTIEDCLKKDPKITPDVVEDILEEFKDSSKESKNNSKVSSKGFKNNSKEPDKQWKIMDHKWIGKDGTTYYDRYDVKGKAHYKDSAMDIYC